MKTLIRQAFLVNEGTISVADVLIKNERIEKIAQHIQEPNVHEINAEGLYLIPGVIDDQVHFREPGFTHKATIHTESRACAAGGVTTFMEMPNTNPQTLTQELLQEKYAIAKKDSFVNYSFFMGVSNHNYDEVMRTNKQEVCGLKIFMGSSTGDMLVDNKSVLDKIFANTDMLIATHCEDETTIKQLSEKWAHENTTAELHPIIRSREACFISSSKAIELAKKHNTRLHILHISTAEEVHLFNNKIPLEQKRITSEACVHHLWFNDTYYKTLGNQIKCNPAIKTENDREAIMNAVLQDIIDIIATDHAPHTWDEKQQAYTKAPSGLPLVQHSLQMMLQHYKNGVIPLEKIVDKMSHAPAKCFKIKERGFIREGYFADLVLIDLNKKYQITSESIIHKCGWSPLLNFVFDSSISKTFVNGKLVFDGNTICADSGFGQRVLFN